MSRILLISANTRRLPYPVYPLGMSVVAAGLVRAGHEVAQKDLSRPGSGMEDMAAAARKANPDVIGISVRNVDDTDSRMPEANWQLGEVRSLVSALRAVSSAPIILGGPGFSLMPEAILAYAGADHGVAGPGAEAMAAMVADFEAGRTPPRVVRGRIENGRDVAPPLLEPGLAVDYAGDAGILGMQTKTGCSGRCLYCSYPAIEGETVRTKDPKATADEAEDMARRFGVETLVFTDAVFNDPEGHYLLVAEELARRGAPVPWSAFFTPRGLGRGELELLKRSGMSAMELGTDGSTDQTLRGMRKDFAFEEAEAVNRRCVDMRIPCAHYIIFGGPGETARTVEKGLNNLRGLAPSILLVFAGLRIYPNTPLHGLALRKGLVSPDDDLLGPVYYFSPDTPEEMLHARLAKGMRGMRHAIYPPDKGRSMMRVTRNFGYKGILWDTLIRFDSQRRTGGKA